MFIWSIRASSLKFIISCVLSVMVVGALIIVIPFTESTGESVMAGVNFDGINGAEDVKGFLESLGWSLKEGDGISEEVTIPDEFDKVFVNYNEIQKRQGLDLSKYKRKKVTRYTFEVTNYPEFEGTVLANVIVYRNRVVGGDICSGDPDGFVCTLQGD